MIPLSDENPTIRTPWVTMGILAAIFGAWIMLQGAGFNQRDLAFSICNLGLVPGELTGRVPMGTAVPISQEWDCAVDQHAINWVTPVISMFLHGSWGHILGNALFLWVFGNNVEDVMGRGRFLLFYLTCGLAAVGAHVLVDPASPVPTVGASGAISGVMGAYLMLFPRVRVKMLFWFIIIFRVFAIPAWAVLVWWFATQLISGLPAVIDPNPELAGGVAFWAHVGGFVAGAALVRVFESPRLVAMRRSAFAGWGVPAG
jgi:membrane associated rhomboid family serine protease